MHVLGIVHNYISEHFMKLDYLDLDIIVIGVIGIDRSDRFGPKPVQIIDSD